MVRQDSGGGHILKRIDGGMSARLTGLVAISGLIVLVVSSWWWWWVMVVGGPSCLAVQPPHSERIIQWTTPNSTTSIRPPLEHADSELVTDWSRIVRDWLIPFNGSIARADVDLAFTSTTGKAVIFQHIHGHFYVFDPEKWCSDPPPGSHFIKKRCLAVLSILEETSKQMRGGLPNFEFVYDFGDLPSWKTRNTTLDSKSTPGFGCVRCWQKEFMSFPMFGSHKPWNISNLDGEIANILDHHPPPLAARRSAAVFRGGMRGCSYPSDHDAMYRWQWNEFPNFYRGAPCGRKRLQEIAQKHPDLVDFVNTDVPGTPKMSMDQQEREFKYIISAEGHGGWTDRLFQLMFYDVAIIVQDHPCKEWYEEMFVPWQHYIPVANDFSNLRSRIMWAERHPNTVEEMVRAKIGRAKRALSKQGITIFSAVLWTRYAELQRYQIVRRNDTIALNELLHQADDPGAKGL